MKEKVLNFMKIRFEYYGLGTGATVSDIIYGTKIRGPILRPILQELINENKIRVSSGEHMDLYYLIV